MSALILMAEDDPDVQLVTRLALKKAGYRVEAVENGRVLLERVRTMRPDLILLDWMMPELVGPATFARLKEDESTRDIPVVFMTSRAQASTELPGAAGWIIKPLDPLKVGDYVRAALDRPR